MSSLIKLGVPSGFLEPISKLINSGESYPKIPEAKGAISAIRSEAFFIPLYELFLTYGGIFRLTFGPKVRLFIFLLLVSSSGTAGNRSYSKSIRPKILFVQ